MERRKLTKADLDKVKCIEGYPVAKDEDIIALSDVPHYIAAPNPFITELIQPDVDPDYKREPFAADVSEGKKDPVYNAHTYHTKVPYKAIMRYVLHYTNPGDVVFDGFCGSGMTGVAAQMCGSLDHELKYGLINWKEEDKWGRRKAIVSDLSPMATFIASLYTTPVDLIRLDNAFSTVINKVEDECKWMYETEPEESAVSMFRNDKGHVDYTVWSDVFICPQCGKEVVFWDAAVDKDTGSVKDVFYCPHCSASMTKKASSRALTTYLDPKLNEVISTTKQVPVLISYSYNGQDYVKAPSKEDYSLIEKINQTTIPYWYPTDRMPVGGESRRNDKYGITHAHHFFTKRNLYVISSLWDAIQNLDEEQSIKNTLMAVVTGVMQGISKLQRFRLNSTFPNMILSGTLYIGSMIREWNVLDWVKGKYKSIRKLKSTISFFNEDEILISTNSLTQTTLNDESIDYIFTDPPFGANLNYSELSFMWESWLKVVTANNQEAIMNPEQNKGLVEYQQLMTDCFIECYRVLKPNRWMTVEFHNSKNSVWNAIQQSLQRAGFVVADVRTLDKKQSSFKQITSSSAVKQDLVISAYKPNEQFYEDFQQKAGSVETAWAFVNQHLANLPVAVVNNGKIEIIAERQAFLLFDRMVAFHIMHGISVPIDAADFYKGLDEKYLKRDGMYFLSNQVNEYDTARIVNDIEPIQFSLMVSNEKTAISWLYQQLDTPQTYSEIQPKFMQEIKTVDKYEDMPELSILLEENFLQDEKGRWYVPDVTKEADIAKLREKNLLKEFEGYLATKGKLKLFRAEAIRVGFAKLWKDKNYKLIVETAERLPEQIIQEDDKLLMYYDISLGRV